MIFKRVLFRPRGLRAAINRRRDGEFKRIEVFVRCRAVDIAVKIPRVASHGSQIAIAEVII